MTSLIALLALVAAIGARRKGQDLTKTVAELSKEVERLAALAKARPILPVRSEEKEGLEEVLQEEAPAAAPARSFVFDDEDTKTAPEAVAAAREANIAPSEPLAAETESPDLAEAVAEPKISPLKSIEQALAGRWFVVIGGAAIALAGLLFIKYAHDNGLIPPWLRVVFGYAFAAALVAAGEYIRRARGPDVRDLVPAALSAAGLITGFGVTYAAYALYDLVPAAACFPILVAIGLFALWLSRMQGPLIAALGIVGSYAAPALVPSQQPSAAGFFFYLIVIASACLFELRNRPWWWVGFTGIGGAFIWALLWIQGGLFEQSQLLPIAMFAYALAAASWLLPRGLAIFGNDLGSLVDKGGLKPPLQVAMAGSVAAAIVLGALVGATHFAFPALVAFAIGMLAVCVFGWLRPPRNLAAPLAALFTWMIFQAWPGVSEMVPAYDERGFWTLVPGLVEPQRFVSWMLAAGIAFTGISVSGLLLKRHPSFWDVLASAASIIFLFTAWARADFVFADSRWAGLAIAAAVILLGCVYAVKSKTAEADVQLSVTALASAGALHLLFASDRLFDGVPQTLVIAVLALGFASGIRLVDARIFPRIASGLAGFAALRLFLARELWGEPQGLLFGAHWPLYGYGLPAVLFWFAARQLVSEKDSRHRISLEGISLGLLISLVSVELRVLIGGGVTKDEPGLLELASHACAWLGAAYGLAYRQKIYSSFVARWGTAALVAAASLVLLGCLTVLNPALSGVALAGTSVFNSLWLAYALPAVLLIAIAGKLPGLGWSMLVRPVHGLAIILSAAFVGLMIHRWFAGPYMPEVLVSYLEFTVIGLAWLAIAIAALEWNRNKPAELWQWFAYGFGALGLVQLVVGLTAANPALTSEALLPNAVVNPLWLGYAVPAGLLLLAMARHDVTSRAPLREICGGLAFALVMMFVTLMVKRAFQGAALDVHFTSDAERYSVSAAWLALGVGAFGWGIRIDRQYIRAAGLAVMSLTLLKVFVYDFAELSGLWRIASLLGLGLCLVGIGWLYSRFVHRPKSNEAA